MVNRCIAFILSFMIVLSSLCTSLVLANKNESPVNTFKLSDIENHWAKPIIDWAINNGVIDGYPDGTFKPDQPISRAEFVALINRSLGYEKVDYQSAFKDIQPIDWYANQINTGNLANYISGYPDNSFKPNAQISRQETAIMISRLPSNFEEMKKEVVVTDFSDDSKIAAWSKEAIKKLVLSNIMNGYPNGTYEPERQTTRAEALAVIYKYLIIAKKQSMIKGAVIINGQKISGAKVHLTTSKGKIDLVSTNTDANGVFEFILPNEGTYDLTVTKDDQLGFLSGVTVESKKTKLIALNLTNAVKIDGTILSAEGEPISAKDIFFTTNPTFKTTTDSNGNFSVYLLPERTYSIYTVVPDKGSDGTEEIYSGLEIGKTNKSLGQIKSVFIDGNRKVKSTGQTQSSSESNHSNNNQDRISPIITIQSPSVTGDTYTVQNPNITLSGIASDNVSVTSVTYRTVTAVTYSVNEGSASGTTNWTIPNINLELGTNVINITAYDQAGNQTSTTLKITYQPFEKPFLNITSIDPLDENKITITGNASLNFQHIMFKQIVTSVSQTVYEYSGTTIGTISNWFIPSITLMPGENTISVTATDDLGKELSSTVSFTEPENIDDGVKRQQVVESSTLNFALSFDATGDASKTTSINQVDVTSKIGSSGVFGQVNITSKSQFDSATLKFSYDPSQLGGTNPNDLRIFYYNPKTQTLEILSNESVDTVNHVISATTTHFSTYILGDMKSWASTWSDTAVRGSNPNDQGKTGVDLIFVIDSSGSMSWNDPSNYRIQGTNDLIDSLGMSDRAAVVDFDNSAKLYHGLTNDKPALKSAADKIDASGGTDIGSGVGKALDELSMNGRHDAKQAIILLTDGDGAYDTTLTSRAKGMGVSIYTIGLSDGINQTLLQGIADQTGGHYYQTNNAKDLQGIFTQTQDKLLDSDGDGLPDWVEKKGFTIKGTMGLKISTDYNKKYSFDDEISDGDRVGDWFYDPDTQEVFISRTPIDINGQPSTPAQPEKKTPVVLIHGILSNSKTAWGANTYIFNNDGLQYIFNTKDNKGEFIKDVDISKTFKQERSYKGPVLINTQYGTVKFPGDTLEYGDIDNQYVRDPLTPGDLANYLKDQGYEVNKNLFVFNWDGNGHVSVAAQELKKFLDNLTDFFKIDSNLVFKNGRAQFNLVGHSAGGLVSRMFIENYMTNSDPNISKLVTVDTPHWGSNAGGNPGTCGNVFQDLDRDDSYLWYSNDKNLGWCGRPNNAPSLKSVHNNLTNYYAISGVKMSDYYKDHSGNVISDPILVRTTNQNAQNDREVFNDVSNILSIKKGISLPRFSDSAILDEDPAMGFGNGFGDGWVTVGSQLGVPSNDQRGKENDIFPIPFTDKFYFIGPDDRVHHTQIEHEIRIEDLIWQLLDHPTMIKRLD